MPTARIVAALAVVGAIAAPAFAQDIASRYTSTATKNCKKVDQAKPQGDGDWVIWSCPGLAGYIVIVSEDDLRTTVSIGRTRAAAVKEPASAQGFRPFNRIQDTLEWRVAKGAPFAVIQRWFISDSQNPDKSGRPTAYGLMVVTRLPPGPVCHVAYVDVRANKDPNALARQAADEHARSFDCKNKPIVIGARGRAIELAMP